MEIFETQILGYLSKLDWFYIITFILIGYGLNSDKVIGKVKDKLWIFSQTRYRMALVGVLYAVATYFLRGYGVDQIEKLFASFVFSIVFHKMIIDSVVSWVNMKFKSSKSNEWHF